MSDSSMSQRLCGGESTLAGVRPGVIMDFDEPLGVAVEDIPNVLSQIFQDLSRRAGLQQAQLHVCVVAECCGQSQRRAAGGSNPFRSVKVGSASVSACVSSTTSVVFVSGSGGSSEALVIGSQLFTDF